MAAPANKTIHNLDGKWLMKKTLSDPIDPILALQGVGWMTRKAVGMAQVTQHTKQYTQDGTIHIDIEQTATGGIKGNTELRTLNWTPSTHADWLFGDVTSRSRMTTLSALKSSIATDPDTSVHAKDIAYLSEGWLPETLEGDVVENVAVNEKAKWSGLQVWGFAEVEVGGVKERWLVRRFAVRRVDKDEVCYARLCYEWAGEN